MENLSFSSSEELGKMAVRSLSSFLCVASSVLSSKRAGHAVLSYMLQMIFLIEVLKRQKHCSNCEEESSFWFSDLEELLRAVLLVGD